MSLGENPAHVRLNARKNAHTIRRWQHQASSNRNLSQICEPLLFKIRVLSNSLKFVGVYFCFNYTQPYKIVAQTRFALPIRHPRKAPQRHPPAPLVDAPTQTSVVVASDIRCSSNAQNPATSDCLVAYSNSMLGSAIDNTPFDAGVDEFMATSGPAIS
jgi:hypothetical protein